MAQKTYKSVTSAGAGMFMETVNQNELTRRGRQWLDDNLRGDRLITKITVDFHNGSAAEFTLNQETPPDGS